jgi:hypothetical protein
VVQTALARAAPQMTKQALKKQKSASLLDRHMLKRPRCIVSTAVSPLKPVGDSILDTTSVSAESFAESRFPARKLHRRRKCKV